MILAVKIGNTTISVAGFEDDHICFSASIETRKSATIYEYTNCFAQMMSFYQISVKEISGIAIASVVPILTNVICQAWKRLNNVSILVVDTGVKTGLNIKKHHMNMGTDLICSAVAATKLYTLPCIVISLGTATTFTAIDQQGCFLGTSITAGLQTSLTALLDNTAKLSEVELDAPNTLVGTSTVDSIKSGLIYGTASMIDGMYQKYQAILEEKATAILTGQYADMILPFCEKQYVYDEFLLLKGLHIIYQKNQKK